MYGKHRVAYGGCSRSLVIICIRGLIWQMYLWLNMHGPCPMSLHLFFFFSSGKSRELEFIAISSLFPFKVLFKKKKWKSLVLVSCQLVSN